MEKLTDIKTINSIEVAEMVGKDHSKLLRDIRRYCQYLIQAKIGSVDFFIKNDYRDSKGEIRPCYEITKKGCDLIANKLTGEKGIVFTAEYVKRFDAMERELIKISPMKMLELQYQAMKEIDERVDVVAKDFNKFKEEMPLFSVDCEELQKKVRQTAVRVLGWYKSPAYNDKSLRSKIYQDIQHEIKREFGVFSYKAICRNQLALAIKILDDYKPPMALRENIYTLNNN